MKKITRFATFFFSVLLMFALTLVPMKQVVPVAHANGGGISTWWEQHVQTVLLTTGNGSAALTAGAATKLALKEDLDGIAWAIAKQMVSQMTQSMVEWINSGFEGSPAFVTDLSGMLRNSVDIALGEYVKSLGGIGEFICSPFKLDVQAALQIRYQESRSEVPSGSNSCKLSGIADNIKNFLGGATEDWGNWIQITSNPQNTPYGAYLEAEAKLNIKLQNEAGKELTILNWGQGFMSKKICEGADGKPAAKGTNCKITTPGGVIAQQINYQLHTGTEELITADEINEIIGALISQLTLQAMKGINGLLGLGGNSSYTDYSYGDGSNTTSYIDSAVTQESLLNVSLVKQQISSSTVTETAYLALANDTLSKANAKIIIINEGQTALANLLGSSGAASIGITGDSTYASAQSRIDRATVDGTLTLAELADLQGKMSAVYSSLTVVAAISPGLTQGADLNAIKFTALQSASVTAKTNLDSLVTQITALLPQIQTALTKLQIANAVFAAGTSSASSTNYAIQKAMTDYIALVQSGAIINQSGFEVKRMEWQSALGENPPIAITLPKTTPSFLLMKEWFVSPKSSTYNDMLTNISYTVPATASCHEQYQKIIDSVTAKDMEQLYFMGGSDASCKLSNSTPPSSSNIAVPLDSSDFPQAVAAGTPDVIHTHPTHSIDDINAGVFSITKGITPNLQGKGASPLDFLASCLFPRAAFVADPLGIWQFHSNPSLCAQILAASAGTDTHNLAITLGLQGTIYEACELAASDTSGKSWPALQQWVLQYTTAALATFKEMYPENTIGGLPMEFKIFIFNTTSGADCLYRAKQTYGLQIERVTEDQFCSAVCPATST